MSSKDRVTLTIDRDLLAQAEQAVRSGHARSVSAYINDAARRGAFVTVDQVMSEFTDRFGEPSSEHYAWALKAWGLPEDTPLPAFARHSGTLVGDPPDPPRSGGEDIQ